MFRDTWEDIWEVPRTKTSKRKGNKTFQNKNEHDYTLVGHSILFRNNF